MTRSTEHHQLLEQAQELAGQVDDPAIAIKILEMVTPVLLSPIQNQNVDWSSVDEAGRLYGLAIGALRSRP